MYIKVKIKYKKIHRNHIQIARSTQDCQNWDFTSSRKGIAKPGFVKSQSKL